MRISLTIDDRLFEQAVALTGVQEHSALFRKGLKALIEREFARRHAALGGSEPGLDSVSRRRPGPEDS